MDDQGLTAL